MTRMTQEPDCAVMCNLINKHTPHKHTHTSARGSGLTSKKSRERVCHLSLPRLIRGFRNKYH